MDEQAQRAESIARPIWTPQIVFALIVRIYGLLTLVALVFAVVLTIPAFVQGGGELVCLMVVLWMSWAAFGMYLLAGGQFFVRVAYPGVAKKNSRSHR